MNVLLIPDSFKDCLPSKDVAEAMRKGVLKVYPEAITFCIQASDGGEGFLESVRSYLPSIREINTETLDPLGRPLLTNYMLSANNKTAYIELAKASGLELLKPTERDPLLTSTYGTGLQILSAIDYGVETIYIGLGGSATNDAGIGIAKSLGYRFFNADGKELEPIGKNLTSITTIEQPKTRPWKGISVIAVNDVLNPLFGSNGAAYTYGSQKGASSASLEELDQGLRNLDKIVVSHLGCDCGQLPGSGAAGGTGYGLKCFLDAEFVSGVSHILKIARFNEMVTDQGIDLILTGEGAIDTQTAYGKLIQGVLTEAQPHGLPVMAICGRLNLSEMELNQLGLTAAAELYNPEKPAGYSFSHASELIEERTVSLLKQHYFHS